MKEANFAFKNQGDFRLDDVSTDWGLGHIGVSFGAAFGDLDRDGDLDLVVNNFDEAVTVYRNNGADGAAIKVRLLGSQSNRWGIGAKVSIKVGDQMQVRYLTLSRGFMSASDPTVHFGVGEAKAIDELVVDWPSGHRQSFVNLDVNTVYVITEPASNGKPQVETPPKPLFVQVDKFKSITDKQQPFDDFRRQPLLPHRLSQMGPGLASGDINDDGLADLFFGAAKGGWGWLERNKGDGVWKADNDLFPAWSDAEGSEDMGVLFLDADGDGDQDLFVASGGIEAEPGQAELRDRLYLNDGTGDFELASDRLPEISSSSGVVAAADFDRDGDLDLFVGGRTVPGSYPESPPSQLLMNEKGQFSDAVAENCPALAKTGMVTGVLWSDYDGDGWLDLWVTHEWGPIRVFRNIEGKLHEETESTGLMNQHGMWNGIAGRDVDGDGDIDYVATNLGRNTMYRATQGNPYKLLYGDFSGEGRNSVVEAYDNAPGKLVPLRSRHLLSQAMPFIEVAYPTYHDYATATVAEMFTQDALDKATILELNQVNNVLLRNNGAGQFTLENLTVLAQFAPGFGVVLDDFNADGYSDAIIVQNSYAPRRETGRMDGGMGLMLAGDGAGNLEAVSPMKSGLVIPGDAKSLVVTDLDGNGWQDLVVGITDEPVMVFENQGVEGRKLVHVQLKGTKGNPTAVGARVTLLRSDGVQQAAEIYAGSGYLSQSASDLYFGLGADAAAESIIVQWPDGQVSEHVPQAGEYKIELSHPTADRKAAAEL